VAQPLNPLEERPIDTNPSPATRRLPAGTTRSSLLLALGFQLGWVVVVIAANALGLPNNPQLAALNAVGLWAPVLFELVFRVPLPRVIQVIYLIFMTAGPFVGSALGMYKIVVPLDDWVHFTSGVMLAWLGLYVIRLVEERVGRPFPRWFILTGGVATALAFASAWEICEFTSDLVVHTTAQGDNAETMVDIFMGSAGGVFAVIIVLVLKRPKSVLPLSLLRGKGSAHEAQVASAPHLDAESTQTSG